MKTTDFGTRLKQLRLEAGLTQAELADSISMSRSGIANWEQGVCEPGVDQLKQLAEVLSMSVDILVDAKPFLSENEMEIIKIFRSFNQEGQDFVEQMIMTAAASGLYKKCAIASAL